MESSGGWEVDLIGADLGARLLDAARALFERPSTARRCVVVEGDAALRDALGGMIHRARGRTSPERDALDALGRAQVESLHALVGRADPSLAARVREDVRDLADALQALQPADASDEVRALVAAYAPLWTARALTLALRALGAEAVTLDARDLLVAPAYAREGDARIAEAPSREALSAALPARGFAVIAAGFATTPEHRTTSLGTAGADHCAAAIAALLGATTVTRWSAAGALRACPDGPAVPSLGYATAGALGACGHPSLRPVAWEPLVAHGITLELAGLDAPARTRITSAESSDTVIALGVVAPISLLHLGGRAFGASSATWRALFVALHDLGVTLLLVAHGVGAQGATLGLRAPDAEPARARLAHLFAWEGRSRVVQSVTREEGALIALGGGGARGMLRALVALDGAGITPLASAQGEGGAGVVVAPENLPPALAALRAAFGL